MLLFSEELVSDCVMLPAGGETSLKRVGLCDGDVTFTSPIVVALILNDVLRVVDVAGTVVTVFLKFLQS